MSNLAHRFRHLRETRKLTQEDLAARAQVARTTIVHLERGKNIGLPYLRKLSDGLKLTDEEWLNLLVDWLAYQLGPHDFTKLTVSTSYTLKEDQPNDYAALRRWVDTLPPARCELLLRAIQHPGFFDLLKAATTSIPPPANPPHRKTING